MNIIPFNTPVDSKSQIDDYVKILQEDLAGIGQFFIQCINFYLDHRSKNNPDQIEDLKKYGLSWESNFNRSHVQSYEMHLKFQDYTTKMSYARSFIEKMCEPTDKTSEMIPRSDLYIKFKDWCEIDQGVARIHIQGKQAFFEELLAGKNERDVFKKVSTQNKVVFVGYKWRDVEADFEYIERDPGNLGWSTFPCDLEMDTVI